MFGRVSRMFKSNERNEYSYIRFADFLFRKKSARRPTDQF